MPDGFVQAKAVGPMPAPKEYPKGSAQFDPRWYLMHHTQDRFIGDFGTPELAEDFRDQYDLTEDWAVDGVVRHFLTVAFPVRGDGGPIGGLGVISLSREQELESMFLELLGETGEGAPARRKKKRRKDGEPAEAPAAATSEPSDGGAA